MGGTKKKTITQMEKQQKLKERKEKGEKRRREEERREKVARAITASEEQLKVIEQEAVANGYVTPYMVSSKLNVRLSIAKQLLRDAEAKGVVRLVSKSPRAIIYAPAKAAVPAASK